MILRVSGLSAQNQLNDSLLFYEYLAFKSLKEIDQQKAIIKKINLCVRNNYLGMEVFKEVKRVKVSTIDLLSQRSGFLWNAAVIAYLNNETDYARHYIKEYESLTNDSSSSFYLLSVLINKYHDTTAVNLKIKKAAQKDSLFSNLHCFMQATKFSRKHHNLYLLSSALLPGSGTMLNGKLVPGIMSLVINFAAGYGVYKLIDYGLYVNAFLWGTGIGAKFYVGNLNLTSKTFYQLEQKQKNKILSNCETEVGKLMNKYPITLSEL